MADLTRDSQPSVDELICFALYSANHAMGRAYHPHLAPLGLTYPQYLVLTALWRKDGLTVGELCQTLHSDTGTVSPVLRRLEKQGHVERKRSTSDERQVHVLLTDIGRKLEAQAINITRCIISDTGLAMDDLDQIITKLHALRDNLSGN